VIDKIEILYLRF